MPLHWVSSCSSGTCSWWRQSAICVVYQHADSNCDHASMYLIHEDPDSAAAWSFYKLEVICIVLVSTCHKQRCQLKMQQLRMVTYHTQPEILVQFNLPAWACDNACLGAGNSASRQGKVKAWQPCTSKVDRAFDIAKSWQANHSNLPE